MKHPSYLPFLRRLTALVLTAALTIPSAFATAGKHELTTVRSIADGLEFINTITTHPQAGRVESYALEYRADGDVFPIMLQGSGTMYSGASINKAVEEATKLGYHVVGAINTDFFSYATGVPMGIVIEDGVYKSSPEGRTALVVTEGQFGLIEKPEVTLTLTNQTNDQSVSLTHLNKWRAGTGGLYLLNEYFSTVSTRTSTPGWMVRMKELDGGELTVNGTLNLEVTELISGSDPVPIGDNEYILTADDQNGMRSVFEKFQVGDRVTLRADSTIPGLEEIQWACGAGDIMAVNGKLTDPTNWTYTDTGRDPRTALGVRGDGSAVLYVVDGRKSGYSGGLSQKDLAQELLDQGCEWIVNLDGGGSSAMSVWVPGITASGIVNRPSDGKPRGCATYLLLVSEDAGDGQPHRLALKNDGLVVLTGTSVRLGETAVLDSGLNPLTTAATDLEIFSQEGLGAVVDGVYTAGAIPGTDTLNLYSETLGIGGTAQIHVVDTLTELTLTERKTSQPVTELKLKPGEQIELDVDGSYFSRVAMRDPASVIWSISGDVGVIDQSGLFTASALGGKSGSITAAAGGLTVTIPVQTSNIHVDVDETHWAYVAVDYCYEKNLVSGISGNEFGPTLNIRRGDFLLMLYRAAGNPKVTTQVNFPDVSPNDYYATAIAWAQENGLASGMQDGTFAPKINVTREQAFTILCRALPFLDIHCQDGALSVLDQFRDLSDLSGWAAQFTATLVSYQIVGGSDGLLNPKGNLSRAEMAALLYKLGHYDPSNVTPVLPEPPADSEQPEQPDAPQLPAIVPQLGYTGQVNSDVAKLNVRAGNGTDFEVLDTLVGGDQVVLLDQTVNDWYRIQYLSKAQILSEGYVSAAFVSPLSPDGVRLPIPGLTDAPALPQLNYGGAVNAGVKTLNVRAGKGTGFEILDTLTAGDRVVILTKDDTGWLQIQYLSPEHELRQGYVSVDYITLNP